MIYLKLLNVDGIECSRMQISVVVLPLIKSSHSRSDTVMQRRKLPWSIEEIKSLVLFLMLYSDTKLWMMLNFWTDAGSFIQLKIHTNCSN